MSNSAKKMALAVLLLGLVLGCSNIPLKDGGLVIGKDTTAGIEDLGVARLTKGF